MEGLLSLLFVGGLFYLMMRYGCGAHMMGHGHTDQAGADKPKDPVCGMPVNADSGYGKIHEGQLYRFCSKSCLDRFDADPSRYLDAIQAEGKS